MPDPLLADPFLALAADVLDDTEAVRIADENRLRQLTRDEPDKDGAERGFGLDLTHPAVASLAAMVRTLKCDSAVVVELTGEKPRKGKGCCLEHDSERNLARMLKGSLLHPWLEAQRGIGAKQGARLLAAIGDPYIRPEMTRKDSDGEIVSTEAARPRLVSELWAYCGLHVIRTPVSGHVNREAREPTAADGQASPGHVGRDAQLDPAGEGGDPGHEVSDVHRDSAGVAPRRTRGQRANWSAAARTRAYLVAESCIKQAESPYRKVYEEGRERYAGAAHAVPCHRCGPKGKPAPEGSPLSAGHQHARAMRLVMKAVLRDLWAEAKRIHEAAAA
jgi:hypothetical protein